MKALDRKEKTGASWRDLEKSVVLSRFVEQVEVEVTKKITTTMIAIAVPTVPPTAHLYFFIKCISFFKERFSMVGLSRIFPSTTSKGEVSQYSSGMGYRL